MADTIPILDLGDVTASDPVARKRASDAVRVGFGTFGLVYVRAHDIDLDARSQFYKTFTEFVGWPEEKKSAYRGTDIWYQRFRQPTL